MLKLFKEYRLLVAACAVVFIVWGGTLWMFDSAGAGLTIQRPKDDLITLAEYWSWRGTFGDMFGGATSLFSALTVLGVAFGITLQQKELLEVRATAAATISALLNQQHVAHVEMRPWIELTFNKASIENDAGVLRLTVQITAHNVGKTQAQNLMVYTNVIWDRLVTQAEVDKFFTLHGDAGSSGFTVLPDGKYNEILLSRFDTKNSSDVSPVIMVCATYGVNDASGAFQHQTGYALTVHKPNRVGDSPSPIAVSNIGTTLGDYELSVAHFNRVK